MFPALCWSNVMTKRVVGKQINEYRAFEFCICVDLHGYKFALLPEFRS